jgi:hypothetical protein
MEEIGLFLRSGSDRKKTGTLKTLIPEARRGKLGGVWKRKDIQGGDIGKAFPSGQSGMASKAPIEATCKNKPNRKRDHSA